MNRPTFVTAFFDIQRSQKGDGRTIDQYLGWITKTLKLNCNLYVFTEAKYASFFRNQRPTEYPMQLVIMDFKDLYFYRYREQMREIIMREDYYKRIQHPTRVECILPEYNIIQYSKFDCLNRAIDENVFHSNVFFWIDAGISRFFADVDISKPYPGERCIEFVSKHNDVLIIQNRPDLNIFPIDDDFIWRSDNLLVGTMFGGGAQAIKEIYCELVGVLENDMLAKNNVNNEQLALAILWKRRPELFYTINNTTSLHLPLFSILTEQ
jgi:hypothetical protein